MRGYDQKTEGDMSTFQKMLAEISITFQAISRRALLLFHCACPKLNILIGIGPTGVTKKKKTIILISVVNELTYPEFHLKLRLRLIVSPTI